MEKSAIKNMGLYAISLFLIKGISLFTLPLMAHYLTPFQIGQLEFLGITTVFFSMLVGLAMHENLYRFIGTIECRRERRQKASQLYTACLLISSSLALLSLAVYQLLGSPLETINDSQFLLMAIVLCYEAPLAIGLAWLRLHNQATVFFNVSVSTVAVQLVLLMSALLYQPDVTVIFAVNVLCTFGQFLFLHFYLGFRFQLPDRGNVRTYLGYSTPLMLSAMVAFVLSGAERWIIAAYTDLETLGIYAIAAKFALGVGILIQPFHMWWMPKRFQVQQSKGNGAVARTTEQGILLLCVIAVGLTWASQLFITYTLPTAYQAASQYVCLAILIMLFKELTEMVNIGILHAKQTSKLLFINLFSIATAASIGLSIVEHGIFAILAALLTGQVCRFVLVLGLSQQLLPLPYRLAQAVALISMSSLMIWSSALSYSSDISALMMVMQPLLIIGLAHRVGLVDITHLKNRTKTAKTYLVSLSSQYKTKGN